MTPQDFDFICRLVRERSGIVLEPGKEYLVETRLPPLAHKLGLESISAIVSRLRSTPKDGLATQVVEAMTTNETLFFRDLTPFESLRTTVLPDLIRRRVDSKRLDVWCAACSTGQEPYSLAILIREHFPELTGWRIGILGTDLSSAAIERARLGVYSQIEVNRGLPIALLMKYFTQHKNTWQLSEEIRQMVAFREVNLAGPWPALARMDLIFLRNVMIYFDTESKKTILGKVARLVKSDGYLLLGSVETTLNLDSSFRRVEAVKGGFFKLVG